MDTNKMLSLGWDEILFQAVTLVVGIKSDGLLLAHKPPSYAWEQYCLSAASCPGH